MKTNQKIEEKILRNVNRNIADLQSIPSRFINRKSNITQDKINDLKEYEITELVFAHELSKAKKIKDEVIKELGKMVKTQKKSENDDKIAYEKKLKKDEIKAKARKL